jgi:hypothetical protein
MRLHEVLRAEHTRIPPAPPNRWWTGKADGQAPPPDGAPQAADAVAGDPPADAFVLTNGEELARRVTPHIAAAGVHPSAAGAAPPPKAGAEDEGHYVRLAQWVRESRGTAAAVPAHTGAATVEEIGRVLTAKLDEDLPHTEPWLQNAELRPFTRGLLKRHLRRAPGSMWKMFGRQRDTNRELNRLLLEDAFVKHVRREDDQKLVEVFRDMRQSGRAALCLSGGGIRSATFALGVTQGFARLGVLPQFRYLSTVSGGGYLGSWLSAWSRHEGMAAVASKLDGDNSGTVAVEAAPVRHLRQYSNYLSPRLGLLSADTWTLVATFLRNLLLIWLVLLPLLAAVVAAPWVVAGITAFRPSEKSWLDPWVLVGMMAFLGAALACKAICFVHAHRPETNATTRGGAPGPRALRDQAAFLWGCLLPLGLGAVAWAIAWRWFSTLTPAPEGPLAALHGEFGFGRYGAHPVWSRSTWYLVAGGAVVHLVAWLVALPFRTYTRKGRGFVVDFVVVVATGCVAGFLVVFTSYLLHRVTGSLGDAAYAVLAVPGFLTAVLLAGFASAGLASGFTDDAEREWTARYSAWILVVSTIWLAAFGVVLFGPHLVDEELNRTWGASVGLGTGILTAVLGRSAHTGSAGKKDGGKKRDWKTLLSRLTLPVAAAVAVVALFVALSYADIALMRWVCSWGEGMCGGPGVELTPVSVVESVPVRIMAVMLIALLVLGWTLGRWVQTNRFSLHAMYRARLIRAYLGASRPAGERRPDPFTGFDEADNIYMGCLNEADAGARAAGGGKPPFHVLNLALNLVAGSNLAWQERRASSFTVSPLHAGASTLGYRHTTVPGMACPAPEENKILYGGKRGITLGTAMTISGAAASPNMGYHSSPAVTFLMTLFNARLGWWLGNPGPAGDDTFHDSSPRSALRPLLDEMLGNTDDANPYVYLSDGGHFENLGLYEMVLRRNRFIVVSDAGCDEECSLQDLGNAIRKVRIDLGIPIEFTEDFPLRARSADRTAPPGRYWAFAKIRYSCVDAPGSADAGSDAVDGVLLYIKPGIYGGEPRDVFNYAAANPAFPHESTADQFFSESQFESYRALGSHAVAQLGRQMGDDLLKLFTTEGQTEFLADGCRVPHSAPTPAPIPVIPARPREKLKIQGVVRVV